MTRSLPKRYSATSTSASSASTSATASTFFNSMSSFSKYIRLLFVIYIIVSLIYTLMHFYLMFFMKQSTSLDGGGGLDSLASSSSSSMTTTDTQRIIEKIVLTKTSTASATTGESINHNLRLSHNLIYSKMFQYALQPTQIIPHFLRMKAQPAASDITITTMITMERLPVLVKLVRKYQGPVSVTLHINSESSDKLQLLERLIQVYMSDEYVSQFLDVHLVLDKYDRQFNMWRNIARMFAATEYVMNMDVDFYLCTDLRANIRKLQPKYKKLLESGKAVFVVPAFEFNRNAVELEADSYPKDKHSLLKYIRSGELSMFHSKWKRGHGPTDYSRWESSEEPYRITQYNYNYEPYVLMRRDGAPWCDERFVGYGSNKAACLYEIYLAGFEFWTLPNDFLVHQRHPYPENDRRMERKYNKRLYDAFREEMCFRYSRMNGNVQNATVVDERLCGVSFPYFYGL